MTGLPRREEDGQEEAHGRPVSFRPEGEQLVPVRSQSYLTSILHGVRNYVRYVVERLHEMWGDEPMELR